MPIVDKGLASVGFVFRNHVFLQRKNARERLQKNAALQFSRAGRIPRLFQPLAARHPSRNAFSAPSASTRNHQGHNGLFVRVARPDSSCSVQFADPSDYLGQRQAQSLSEL